MSSIAVSTENRAKGETEETKREKSREIERERDRGRERETEEQKGGAFANTTNGSRPLR